MGRLDRDRCTPIYSSEAESFSSWGPQLIVVQEDGSAKPLALLEEREGVEREVKVSKLHVQYPRARSFPDL